MITLLTKILIKPSFSEEKKRSMYGMICGIAGIILNLCLAGAKVFAGFVSGSIAITADAMNNLSDAGSSILTLVGFRLSTQKPDSEHPYGHGRMEYASGLLIATIILSVALNLLKESIGKIIHPVETVLSIPVLLILILSILVKCYMAFYNHSYGKKLNSATIRAACVDSLSDCVVTLVVLLTTVVSHFTSWHIDGFAGVVVALFVGYAGLNALRDTLNPLLGQPPEKAFLDQIRDTALHYDAHIIGIHDLLVHDYGPARRFVTFHAEVPAEDNIVLLHEIIDALEHKMSTELGCFVTIHMDPIETRNEKVNALRTSVEDVVHEMNEGFSLHDFRVVLGENRINLIFDLLIPMSEAHTDSELKSELNARVKKRLGDKYFCVVEIDHDMGSI